MTDRPQIVKCPRCGRRIAYYDGRGQIDIYTACKRCHIGAIFFVRSRVTLVRPYPQIRTPYGMRLF